MLSVIRTGLDAATREIAVVSNNIANSAATGFKNGLRYLIDTNLIGTLNCLNLV